MSITTWSITASEISVVQSLMDGLDGVLQHNISVDAFVEVVTFFASEKNCARASEWVHSIILFEATRSDFLYNIIKYTHTTVSSNSEIENKALQYVRENTDSSAFSWPTEGNAAFTCMQEDVFVFLKKNTEDPEVRVTFGPHFKPRGVALKHRSW